jgi:hypothetical protein
VSTARLGDRDQLSVSLSLSSLLRALFLSLSFAPGDLLCSRWLLGAVRCDCECEKPPLAQEQPTTSADSAFFARLSKRESTLTSVSQQGTVGGMMDVGLYHRAIHPQLPPSGDLLNKRTGQFHRAIVE